MQGYSLVNVDWSNGKNSWATATPMNATEMLVAQAAVLTAANPNQRVWIYKNIVKALPFFSEVREKLIDPAYSGWFLPFKSGGSLPNGTYHVPTCDTAFDPPRCSTLYHDQEQTPQSSSSLCGSHACDCGDGLPCGEYLWNHKNESLRSFLLNEYITGPTGVGANGISGVYLDDQWSDFPSPVDAPDCGSSPIGGPTEEDGNCVVDMGLSQSDTTAIYSGWKQTMIEAASTLIAAGGFSWAFTTEMSIPSKGAVCRAFFTENATALADVPLIVTVHSNSSVDELAFFLTVRGPYAWIGYGWRGCTAPPPLPEILTTDVGTPLGNFSFNGSVASREWTNVMAAFDCSTGHGSVTIKS
jgi:hypothetical protein